MSPISDRSLRLTQNSVGKQFFLHFLFSGRSNVDAVDKVLQSRRKDGEWRNLEVDLVSGGKQRIYISPDENQQMQLSRIMGKAMVKILKDLGHDGAHFRQKSACVHIDRGEPLALIKPISSTPTPESMRWNNTRVDEFSLDKANIRERVTASATSPVHRVEWSL